MCQRVIEDIVGHTQFWIEYLLTPIYVGFLEIVITPNFEPCMRQNSLNKLPSNFRG